ncbi:hypothetical protein ACSC85_004584 [Escherichia coli]|uniref:hypothetical protein n=1 Tax=Escherichia coli TaxID=562 RepID=UPI00039F0F62|nr:hypothetical protein [Escherichia coli]EEZ5766699.1 ash family protein [Escherichia coli O140]HDQ6497644.1 hypothetical protein [Escherichia coli O117:H4]HDQ6516715.1 hypothetical protein [Escherichia coli O22:H16]HDQ6716108.1 hypothetical protein [Escherichia coli O113:H4]HDQ6881465.1 hypothetical protein [Escherichia coli O174:H8]
MEIGICNPELLGATPDAQRLFYCRKLCHVRIMAGWRGRFGAPVSSNAGIANLVSSPPI